MKSLFALGAWSIAALAFTGFAHGQYSSPTPNHYWATSEGAVGSGVAPTTISPPSQTHAAPAPQRGAPTFTTPSYTTPNFGQVNYQRGAVAPQVAPPSELPAPGVSPAPPMNPPAPAPAPSFNVGPSQVGPAQIGPAQIGPTHIGPAQIGPSQVGPAQIGIDPAQIGVSPAQHGLGAGILNHHHRSTGWFGGAGGLFLDRDNSNSVWLSVDDGDISRRVLTTRDAEMNLSGGFEASIGRYFNNNCCAWQLSYWGIFPVDQNAYAYNADQVGQLGSSRTFDGLDYNGATVASAYNLSDAHWLRRDYAIHNVEWNIMGNPCVVGCGGKGHALFGGCGSKCGSCSPKASCGGCGGAGCSSCYAAPCSRWRWNWLAGLRFFRFDEGFLYAADAGDTTFDGAIDEVYYGIDVKNNLFGFQVGGIADYCVTGRWNWRNAVKLGVYGNHIDHYSHMGGAAGTVTVNNINSPYNGQDFRINSNKNDVAMMAELDSGVAFQWSCHWRARIGYRVLGLTGVAFAPNQIPTATFTDLHDVAVIDSNGSLILHGGYASLEYSY